MDDPRLITGEDGNIDRRRLYIVHLGGHAPVVSFSDDNAVQFARENMHAFVCDECMWVEDFAESISDDPADLADFTVPYDPSVRSLNQTSKFSMQRWADHTAALDELEAQEKAFAERQQPLPLQFISAD